QSGTALEVPLRIHLSNPLGGLVGEHCYIGGPEEPIVQRLTSGETSPPEGFAPISGELGEVAFSNDFQILRIRNNRVVDNTYPDQVAHGFAKRNDPEWEGLIDEAVDTAFHLPAPAGASVTEVKGTLWNAGSVATKEALGE